MKISGGTPFGSPSSNAAVPLARTVKTSIAPNSPTTATWPAVRQDTFIASQATTPSAASDMIQASTPRPEAGPVA